MKSLNEAIIRATMVAERTGIDQAVFKHDGGYSFQYASLYKGTPVKIISKKKVNVKTKAKKSKDTSEGKKPEDISID